MANGKISFHKAADQFLTLQYENNWNTVMYLVYKFTKGLTLEAKRLAKSASLSDMDYQDAVVSTWFYYAGLTDLASNYSEERVRLLHEYFDAVSYPEDHRAVVELTISIISDNSDAENKVQQVVSDAILD
ncbi:MAG: hypothetical protein EOP49_20895 [Sphingobacteriales bacterium]|nr:MAG: hypothetical protein EOP49_20895 [Sphingobacteriales bacterium]